MRKIIFILSLLLSVLMSCLPNKSEDNTISENPKNVNGYFDEMEVYNDILNDLIENYFYNRFLGENKIDLMRKYYFTKEIDSSTYINTIATLTKELKNDPSKRKTIFLKTNLKETSFTIDDFEFIRRSKHIDDFLKNLRTEGIIDSLNRFNSRLKPSDFDLQLARIKEFKKQKKVDISKLSLKEIAKIYRQDPLRNEIGVFAFSKLFLNSSKDTGLLYYFFNCGPKCGVSAVLLFQKKAEKWKIVDINILDIS